MTQPTVTGLNLAEAALLKRLVSVLLDEEDAREWFSRIHSDYSDEDDGPALHSNLTDTEKCLYLLGRIHTKLDAALPTVYYYMRQVDSLEKPVVYGPFTTKNVMILEAYQRAHTEQWTGIVWTLVPLDPTLMGECNTIPRYELEAYWYANGFDPFTSHFEEVPSNGGSDLSNAKLLEEEEEEDEEEDEDCYEEDDSDD